MMARNRTRNTAVTCGAWVTEFSMFSAMRSRMRSCGTERGGDAFRCPGCGVAAGAAAGWARRASAALVDIGAGDAAGASGALDGGGIKAMLEKAALHSGREAELAIESCARPERRRGALVMTFCQRPATSLRTSGRRRFGLVPHHLRDDRDPAEHGARRGFGVAVQQDFAQYAGGWRGHFDGDLVGLELDQRVVDLDPVSDRLQPGADDRLGAFLLGGNEDIDQCCQLRASPLPGGERVG
jgi:hypothetical protein